MSEMSDTLIKELAPFADLGVDPPLAIESGSGAIVKLVRLGKEVTLTFGHSTNAPVVARWQGEEPNQHRSFKALLASDRFSDLRKWADVQSQALTTSLGPPELLLSVKGVLADGQAQLDVAAVDDMLVTHHRDAPNAAQVLLVNGPAGVGKTIFIQQLAARRAKTFKTSGRPLILHVQSRGRNLSFIADLMAFSLQTLRLNVTYDQVPVLVRQGLVTLAIDGFDELGDPSGYSLAWAQVNELVSDIRGKGTLILAGRETFIGRDRLLRDISALSVPRDTVDSLTLQPPEPNDAKRWLMQREWSQEQIESVDELFESGSYALRPFFLSKLAEPDIASRIGENKAGYPLAFLVDRMIEREATKFGDAVEAVLNDAQRVTFIRQFLREVARDMADNQTEAIDETAMSWMVEAANEVAISPELLSLLKNRAAVMAFLANDERVNYRRFAHSQLLNYFLSEVTINTLSHGEIPKYIRRNILGADFLTIFGDVLSDLHGKQPQSVKEFLQSIFSLVAKYASTDRGARNLGSLMFSALPVMDVILDPAIRRVDVDDAVIIGNTVPVTISDVTINQLDARGADMRELQFSNTVIGGLIADDGTVVPSSFPIPSFIQDESLGAGQVIPNPRNVAVWLDSHGKSGAVGDGSGNTLVPANLRDHEILRLLGRACRYREYWLRSDGDERAAHIVRHPDWPLLTYLLNQHGFLKIDEAKQVSGKQSTFYHIKNRTALLAESPDGGEVTSFYRDLIAKIAERDGVG